MNDDFIHFKGSNKYASATKPQDRKNNVHNKQT